MKIQYLSDVHLEFGPAELPATDADVIVAAGDIGIGATGAEWLKAAGKPTIYIAGNHEYYGGDLDAVQGRIRETVVGTDISFLKCTAIEIDTVRFLGATFWTDFLGENEQLMGTLAEHMNDFQQITYQGRQLSPADLTQINRASSDWLEAELATAYSGKTVVVTHHAPLFASWDESMNAIFKGAYCNNLSRLIIAYPIDLWIHGHVHSCSDYRANELRVVCNPRGYDGYQLVEGYDPTKTLTLQ